MFISLKWTDLTEKEQEQAINTYISIQEDYMAGLLAHEKVDYLRICDLFGADNCKRQSYCNEADGLVFCVCDKIMHTRTYERDDNGYIHVDL
jgi:hypothetical protein